MGRTGQMFAFRGLPGRPKNTSQKEVESRKTSKQTAFLTSQIENI